MALSLIILFDLVLMLSAIEKALPTHAQFSRIKNSTCTIHEQAEEINADCSNRNLTELPNWSSISLGNIKTLNLSHNHITTLSSTSFNRLNNLKELYLNSNSIQFSNLPDNTFQKLANLQILHIHDNHPYSITLQTHYYLDKLLSPLASLRDLKMDAVVNDTFGQNFKKLKNLTSLSLSCHVNQGQIKNISKDIFEHLRTTSITHLDLRGCNITHIHRNAFTNLPQIYEIDLSNNQYLPFAMIAKAMYGLKTKSIRTLKLNNICPISTWVHKHKYFNNFKRLPLTHLFLDDNAMSQITEFIPKSLQYLSLSKPHLRTASSLKNYSEFEILQIFKSLKMMKSASPVSLILRDNDLPYIDIKLAHITNLTYLDLSDNEIIYIGPHMRRDIEKLAKSKRFTINLHGNTIYCVDMIRFFLAWLYHTRAYLIRDKNAYKCEAFNGQSLPHDFSSQPLATSIGDLYLREPLATSIGNIYPDEIKLIAPKLHRASNDCLLAMKNCEKGWIALDTQITYTNKTITHEFKNIEQHLLFINSYTLSIMDKIWYLCASLSSLSALSIFEFKLILCMSICIMVSVRKLITSEQRRYRKLVYYYYRFRERINLFKIFPDDTDTFLNRDVFLSFPDNLQDLIQNTVLPELEINQSLQTYIVKRDLRPGRLQVCQIFNAICYCRKMVVFINNEYIANEDNVIELKLALLQSTNIRQVKIIPVFMEPINFERTDEVMKTILTSLPSVKFCQPFDVVLNEVVERINDKFMPAMPQPTAASYSIQHGHDKFKCKTKHSKRRRHNTVRIS